MDTTGFVFSAASLGIQLGETVFGLSRFLSDKGPSTKSLALAMTHEYEQSQRLKRVLHENGKFGLNGCLLDEMDDGTRTLVNDMFAQVRGIWEEFMQIYNKNVPRQSDAGSNATSDLEENVGNAIANWVEHTWSISDNERLEWLVTGASSWNMRLERTLRTFQWIRAADAPSPTTTITRLSQIATDGDAAGLGWKQDAQLKKLVLAMTNLGVDRHTLPIPPALDMGKNSVTVLTPNPRAEGLLQGYVLREDRSRRNVLLEFRKYSPPVQGRSLDDAVQLRVEQLTALLMLAKENPAFGLAPACGYYHDEKNFQFGIVFDLQPQMQTVTLRKLLDAPKRPSLGGRLKLSMALARSLSKLQSISWVHQGIRSEHIVFLHKARSEPCYDLPVIFGYGNSRPESAVSNAHYDNDPVRNLYRHPNRWGTTPLQSFNKLHDIYSLGVVLLEIGFWKPVKELVRSNLTERGAHPADVKANLLDLAKNKRIEDLMGERFRGIVLKCLEGDAAAFGVDAARDDKEDSMLQAAFKAEVVTTLVKATDSITT